MSDFVYTDRPDLFVTPLKNQVKSSKLQNSYKEIYLNSIKKQKNKLQMCSLCLLCSHDCSNFRCINKQHFVCSECACDWIVDKLCPVCKHTSQITSKTDKCSTNCQQDQKTNNTVVRCLNTKKPSFSEDNENTMKRDPNDPKKINHTDL